MSEEQQQLFLQELHANAELMDCFSFEQQLREDLDTLQQKKEMHELAEGLARDPAETAHIKSLIEEAAREWHARNEMEAETDRTGAPFIKRWMYYVAAAAVVILVSGIIYLYMLPPKGSTEGYNKLYAQHFVKDTIPHAVPQMLAQALADYDKNVYSGIQQYDLKNLPNLKGNDASQKQQVLELGYYYKGVSFMVTNEYKNAQPCLEWVINNVTNENLKRKAEWYLALSYLKTSEKDKALKLLKVLAADTAAGDLQQKASLLTDEILHNDGK
jgi:hypothetical protein